MAIMVVSIALVLIFCYLYATSGTRSDSGAYGSSYYSETYQSSTGSYAGSYGSSYYADTYQSGIGSYSGAYGSSYYANTYDHSPNFRPYTEERSLTDAPESNIGYSPPSITKRPSRFRNIQNVLSRSRTADETVTRTRRMIVSTFVKSTLRQKSAKQKDGKVRKRIVKKRGPWDGCVGSIEEKECVVCTEDKAVAEFPKQLTPQCTHTTDICKICIDRWIATQMEQGTVPIKCIDQACQGRLDHKGIRLLMKEDTLQRYDKALKNMAQNASPSLHWRLRRPIRSHNEKVAHTAGLRVLGMRDCPKCGVTIKKEDGCDHITCRGSYGGKPFGCGFEFCYVCGAPYKGPLGIFDVGNTAHDRSCQHYQ